MSPGKAYLVLRKVLVAVASILAKSFFEEEVNKMCRAYGIEFRKINPNELPIDIIKQVFKTHFSNILEILEKKITSYS